MITTFKNIRSFTTLLAVIGLTAFSLNTQAADKDSRGQLTASDFKFATEAAKGGAMEVKLGQLAQERASSDAVKQFGQHMIEDHTKAGNALQQIAAQKGATLDTIVTSAQQKKIDKLSKLSGADFDKEYVDCMVKDHKADLKEFKKASENAKDADLKNFAASTATVVEGHLHMIQGIQDNMKH